MFTSLNKKEKWTQHSYWICHGKLQNCIRLEFNIYLVAIIDCILRDKPLPNTFSTRFLLCNIWLAFFHGNLTHCSPAKCRRGTQGKGDPFRCCQYPPSTGSCNHSVFPCTPNLADIFYLLPQNYAKPCSCKLACSSCQISIFIAF